MAQGAASAAIAFMQAKEGARSRLSRGPPSRSVPRRRRSARAGTARAYALDIVDREAVARAFAAAEAELSPVSRVGRPDRAVGGKGPSLSVSRLVLVKGALASCIGQLPFPQAKRVAAESGVLRSASCRARPVSRGANIANSAAAVRT
jgi:hypothetical protein